MYPTDFEEFKRTLSDLCVAVNRPFNDDLVRVFWEDLRRFTLPEVQSKTRYVRAAGKRQFTSSDLRPDHDEKPPIPSTYTPPPAFDLLHAWGQRCLLAFAQIEGPFDPAQLRNLIDVKNEIVDGMRKRRDEISREWVDVLLAALRRALQRAAA